MTDTNTPKASLTEQADELVRRISLAWNLRDPAPDPLLTEMADLLSGLSAEVERLSRIQAGSDRQDAPRRA